MSPWNLNCEVDGRDRNYGINKLSQLISYDSTKSQGLEDLAKVAYILVSVFGGLTFAIGLIGGILVDLSGDSDCLPFRGMTLFCALL